MSQEPNDALGADSTDSRNRQTTEDECLVVLRLWLQWNDQHEKASQDLYADRDTGAIEQLLDRLDAMRQEAVARSRRLTSL